KNYHSFAMILRPICEPVELPLGTSVIVERVTIGPDTPEIGRFMHFHDVAELVLFRRVRGMFIAGGRRHAICDGAIIFVPSMRNEDGSSDYCQHLSACAPRPRSRLASNPRPVCAASHPRISRAGSGGCSG